MPASRDADVSAIEAYLLIHRALARLEAQRNAADPLMAEYAIPLFGRRAGGAPATGRAACPICWSPKAGWVFGSTQIRARADRRERAWPRPARTIPAARGSSVGDLVGRPVRRGRLPAGDPLLDLVHGAYAERVRRAADGERGALYGSDCGSTPRWAYRRCISDPVTCVWPTGRANSSRIPEIVTATRTLVLAALRAAGSSAHGLLPWPGTRVPARVRHHVSPVPPPGGSRPRGVGRAATVRVEVPRGRRPATWWRRPASGNGADVTVLRFVGSDWLGSARRRGHRSGPGRRLPAGRSATDLRPSTWP